MIRLPYGCWHPRAEVARVVLAAPQFAHVSQEAVESALNDEALWDCSDWCRLSKRRPGELEFQAAALRDFARHWGITCALCCRTQTYPRDHRKLWFYEVDDGFTDAVCPDRLVKLPVLCWECVWDFRGFEKKLRKLGRPVQPDEALCYLLGLGSFRWRVADAKCGPLRFHPRHVPEEYAAPAEYRVAA